MSVRLLTAQVVATLKPRERLYAVRDSLTGIELRVRPDGHKSWTLRYRAHGVQRRWKLGDLKSVSLAEARKRANNIKLQTSNGVDPRLEARKAKMRAEAEARRLTVGSLAESYMTDYARKQKRTWKTDQRILNNYVLPKWKTRKAEDIARRDVRALVEDIAAGRHEVFSSSRRSTRSKATGPAPVMANRVLEVIRTMFNFAVDREHVEVNPAARITEPGAEGKRERVLTDDEIRRMWTACDGLSAPMAALFRLRLIAAQRRGETATMRWQDVDLDAGWWTIPAERSKNGQAHRVPLTEPALRILRELRAQSPKAKPGEFVLAGARGRRQQGLAAATFDVDDFIGHDLRRTAATRMGEAGVERFHIALVLNHRSVTHNTVTAVYDRYSYDKEKRAALETWATALTAIIVAKPNGNTM
jgi:integrase